MKKVIIYVGLHKTGSTSIQAACRDNINALQRAGYSYPLIVLGSQRHGALENHSALFLYMFKHKLKEFKFGAFCVGLVDNIVMNDLQSKVYRLLKDNSASNLLFAAEEVSDFSIEELTNLKEFFAQFDREVEILCTVRRPADWLHSIVASEVSNPNGPKFTLNQVVNRVLTDDSILSSRVKNLQIVFPDIRFSLFRDVIKHPGGVVGHFFDSIDVDLRLPNYHFNTRSGDHSVRLISAVNEEVRKDGIQINNASFDRLHHFWATCGKDMKDMQDAKFLARKFEIGPLISIVEKENEWLRTTFGERYGDAEIRFSEEPVFLNADQRDYLLSTFGNALEPLGRVVRSYVTQH